LHHREPRRVVSLAGFGLQEDGSTFDLRVLDLSYDGCRISASQALAPGTNLKISVVGLGPAIEATVRWADGGKAGLRFLQVSQPEKDQKPRMHERLELQAQIALRRPGRSPYHCRTFDITPKGCKLEFVERPRREETVWVKFDGLDGIEATVRWVEGFYGGVEFVRPIYPAVFDMLLARLKGAA
jgi:hypothetical protein